MKLLKHKNKIYANKYNGSQGVRWSFFLFRSVLFLYVCWFRFGFSHKPKSMRPDGRPLFFFSRPRPNVSRLRRPGAARAQPSNETIIPLRRVGCEMIMANLALQAWLDIYHLISNESLWNNCLIYLPFSWLFVLHLSLEPDMVKECILEGNTTM